MINIPGWFISCGAREIILDKTTTPKEIIKEVKRLWFKPGFYYFTQSKKTAKDKTTQAEQFVKYIKKHKLGIIHASPETKGPRAIFQAWIWEVDRQRLIDHTIAE